MFISKIMPIHYTLKKSPIMAHTPAISTSFLLPSFAMLPGSNPKFATAAGMAKMPAPTTSATMIPAVRKTWGNQISCGKKRQFFWEESYSETKSKHMVFSMSTEIRAKWSRGTPFWPKNSFKSLSSDSILGVLDNPRLLAQTFSSIGTLTVSLEMIMSNQKNPKVV